MIFLDFIFKTILLFVHLLAFILEQISQLIIQLSQSFCLFRELLDLLSLDLALNVCVSQ